MSITHVVVAGKTTLMQGIGEGEHRLEVKQQAAVGQRDMGVGYRLHP